jgi:hypothetical protein
MWYKKSGEKGLPGGGSTKTGMQQTPNEPEYKTEKIIY